MSDMGWCELMRSIFTSPCRLVVRLPNWLCKVGWVTWLQRHPTSKVLEAYSWILHKLKRWWCSREVTKQDTKQSSKAQMARWEHVVFGLLITCLDASVTELLYCNYYDGIPDSIIQDSVGVSVVSEGMTQCWTKKKRHRRKKGLQLHPSPTVGNHQSIPPLLQPTYI